jgi:hypothetical protein
MPKLFPPGYWPDGYVDGALSGDEGGAAFRNASATITAGGTVTATATATGGGSDFADAAATITAGATLTVATPTPQASGGRRSRRKRANYMPRPAFHEPPLGVKADAAAQVVAGSGVAARLGATVAASARVEAGSSATGAAVLAIGQDHTETDNAFWAMAA